MKTKLKSIITAALALAMSFTTSSALAATFPANSSQKTTVEIGDDAITVAAINALPELADIGSDDIVELTLIGSGAKTLTFDEEFKGGSIEIVYDGALKLIRDSAPADLAKFDFSKVTGPITHGWYRFNDKKVIAINFNATATDNKGGGGDNNHKIGEAEDSGALDIDGFTGAGWLQVTTQNSANSDYVSDAFVYDTATGEKGDSVEVKWSSANNYMYRASTAKIIRGYLDDGGNHAQVSVKVPFEYYDVVVYLATDQDGRKFDGVTVNGTTYTYQNGKAVPGSASWGLSRQNELAYGVNAILIAKQMGDLSIIGGANSGDHRGGVAAIMIVETQATVKDVNCGTEYSISSANAFTEDIVNLNFVAEGGVLTLDAAPARDFNIVSEGAITVKFGNGVSINDSIAKLNCKGVEGEVKFVITDGTVPTTAPASGVTYRWEGATALTAIPFAQDQVAGTLEIACPLSVAADAKVEVFRNKNIVFDGNFALNASAFICGNKVGGGDPTPSQTITQNAGAITLTKEYTGAETTSDMPLLFAHWPSTVVYNLVGGSITAENGNVMFGRDGTIAMTVGGDDNKTATFKARGISRNGRYNTSSITISKNGTVLVGVGGVNFTANKKIVLNGGTLGAYDNATITTTMNLEVTAASTIDVAEGKTLTLAAPLSGSGAITKTGAGKLVITGSRANFTGTITIAEGTYDIGYVRDFNTIGNITTSGEGKIKVVAVAADDGIVKIVNVPADLAVEVYDIGGVDKLEAVYKEGTITASCSIQVDGAACYYDWTFTNTVQTTGAKGINTSAYSQNQASLTGDSNTSYADKNDEDLYTSLYISVRPYLDLNWDNIGKPMTVALACKMSEYPNTELIALGNQSKCFFFATTEIPNEVQLVYGTQTTDNQHHKCEVITTMSVPAASTAFHVYEITLSADGKTVTVYLDGIEWASSYKAEGFGMNNGLQMGGWFQGNYENDGFYRDGDSGRTDTDKVGRIKMLRVYNSILGPNAMAKLNAEFPYNPQFGAYSRTLDEAAEEWSATEAWTDDEGQQADIPVNESVANLTVGVNSELTINAGEEIHQESISIVGQNNEGQTLKIKAGSGTIINDGATIITTPVTIEYGAMTIAGGPTKINGNGSVTFDFSEYPIETVFSEGHLGLTGLCDAPESDDKTTWPVQLIVPDDLKGRTMTLEYTSNNKYELVCGFERSEGTTLYLALTETETTTINNDTVFTLEDGTTTALRFYADDKVILTGTGEFSVASNLAVPLNAITIADGATAKLADNLFAGTITVNAGGVLDVNGKGSSNYAITLNGGELANTGDATFVPGLTVTANSSVNLTSGLSIQSSAGGWNPTTIALGEYTLAKKGEGQFTLVATTITGTGTLDIQSGKVYSSESTTFTDGVMKIAAGVTYQQRGLRTTTVAKIIGAEGALLQNNNDNGAGTISAFTLEGAIKLVGTGNFGTITLAENAAIDIATQRGLTLAGAGTVKATITAAEIATGSVTVFKAAEGAAIDTVTLVDADGEALTGFTADYDEEGNYIAYFTVTFTVPAIDGATASINVGTLEGGTATVAYGADATITYTADEGKFFADGAPTLPVSLEDITDAAAAELAIATKIEGASTVDAGAKIGDAYYFDIPTALTAAQADQTVVVLQPAQLESLVVPTGVTLDLNNKLVGANAIENNGTIVIYDEATAMALIDTHGTIRFGKLVTINVGYQFPAGTTITIVKRSAPGATESLVELPQNSILINLVGAAAKKVINVYPENPQNGALLLAGAIERGSHDVDTIINVGGYTLVGAPLIIGEDGKGMDYETYPNNKAKLISTFIQFDDEMVSEMVGYPVQGCIQLIPGVGVLQTATDLSSVIGTRLLTLEGAEIKDSFDGTIHTYTAEWKKSSIIPEEQGTVEITGEGENAVAKITPKEGVTKLEISAPDGFMGKYEIPVSITEITGVEMSQLIIKSGEADIATACKLENGAILLNEAATVTVGGEQIPVKPVLSDATDEEKPLAVSSESTSVGVKTIPGLTYTLVRSTTIGGTTTDIASALATGARLSLTDNFAQEQGGKPASAFYVIRVTK